MGTGDEADRRADLRTGDLGPATIEGTLAPDWEQRYRNLVLEVDEQERHWSRVQRTLQQAVVRLSVLCTGTGGPADDRVNALCDAVRDELDLDELEHHIARLPAVPKPPAGGPGAPSPRDTRLAQWVRELLSALAELEELGESLPPLLSTLREKDDPAELQAVLDDIRRRVSASLRRLDDQRQELEGLLVQVESRLAEFQGYAQFARDDLGRSVANRTELREGVDFEVRDLRSAVNQSADIGVLKERINERLDRIGSQFEQFHAQEEARIEQATERAEALQERVRELEHQTEALRERCRQGEERLNRDELTQVASRHAYQQELERQVVQWRAGAGPLCLALCDLDRFKAINDTYGHATGDRVLVGFARIAGTHVKRDDFLARIGGEEFAVLMPDTDLETATRRMDALRQALAKESFPARGGIAALTVSIGITQFEGDDSSVEAYERADGALYAAKQGGRNRCVAAAGPQVPGSEGAVDARHIG